MLGQPITFRLVPSTWPPSNTPKLQDVAPFPNLIFLILENQLFDL